MLRNVFNDSGSVCTIIELVNTFGQINKFHFYGWLKVVCFASARLPPPCRFVRMAGWGETQLVIVEPHFWLFWCADAFRMKRRRVFELFIMEIAYTQQLLAALCRTIEKHIWRRYLNMQIVQNNERAKNNHRVYYDNGIEKWPKKVFSPPLYIH